MLPGDVVDQLIRVLVVDDSAFMRRVISSILERQPDFRVVGFAVDGLDALEKVASLRPDVVTLDVEMPKMDGLQVLQALRRRGLFPGVVVLSALTARGPHIAVEALAEGAVDVVAKPQVGGSQTLMAMAAELVEKVRAAAQSRAGDRKGSPAPDRLLQAGSEPEPLLPRRRRFLAPEVPASPGRTAGAEQEPGAGSQAAAPAPVPLPKLRAPLRLVVVASSTGGPSALGAFLSHLPKSLPVPVVVVQHMPAGFTRALAARLNANGPLPVQEAGDGQVLRPGLVLVAPAGHQATLERSGEGLDSSVHLALDRPPIYASPHRPSADALFRSAAAVFGPQALAVVLTGMGRDGLAGAQALGRAGGVILAQDEASCVVYGMPRAVAEAGLASLTAPPEALAGAVAALAGAPAQPGS